MAVSQGLDGFPALTCLLFNGTSKEMEDGEVLIGLGLWKSPELSFYIIVYSVIKKSLMNRIYGFCFIEKSNFHCGFNITLLAVVKIQ